MSRYRFLYSVVHSARGPNTAGLPPNVPPPVLSSFGHFRITPKGDLTISIVDITGAILYNKTYPGRTELPLTTTDVFVQSGDVTPSSVVLNARCNKEVNSQVTFAYGIGAGPRTLISAGVTSATDYNANVLVSGLSSSTAYTFNATCVGGGNTTTSVTASFKTAPPATTAAAQKFVWAADLAGQGWCRWPGLRVNTVNGSTIVGGYPIFQTMQSLNPDFAIFQGDMIYADNACNEMAIMPEGAAGGGAIWYNNPSKPFVAVSLSDFRYNWKYNQGDTKLQNFLAQTPVLVQWDDHEVSNNWFPGKILGPPSYPNNTQADVLAANARQSFYEFNPIMPDQLIYRTRRFGQHLEVFLVDMRSYRASNVLAANKTKIAMMGETQLTWLLNALKASTATWKILSMDDPISIITGG
jgi:alkaline phosphatase D